MSWFTKSFGVLVGLLTLTAAITACNSDSNSSSGSSAAYGSVNIAVTDDPFPFDYVQSAVVTIVKIEMRNQSTTDSWVTAAEGTFSADLVNLRNGIMQNLVTAQIPAGQYDQVRLVISEATIVLKDSRSFDLRLPSAGTSGLKVNIDPPISVVSGVSTDLLLDIDASRSFKAQGNPSSMDTITGFSFDPVLRAINLTSAGTLAGTIKSNNKTLVINDDFGLNGVLVTVWQNDGSPNAAPTLSNTVATAVTDSTGAYKIVGVLPGLYSVTLTHSGYTATTVDNIFVVAGNVSNQDSTLAEQ